MKRRNRKVLLATPYLRQTIGEAKVFGAFPFTQSRLLVVDMTRRDLKEAIHNSIITLTFSFL